MKTIKRYNNVNGRFIEHEDGKHVKYEDVKILIEALKFYSTGEHMEGDDFDTETCDQGDFDIHEYKHGAWARRALRGES